MADDEMSPSPPAPSDPRLPLTPMQVFKLKKSWKGIKRCLDDTGVEMFVRYFDSNFPSRQLFSRFRHMGKDELRVDEELEKLAGKVMLVFDQCVQSIDNVDNTEEVMSQTAASHRATPGGGFAAPMFMDFEVPFLEAVKIMLGDRYTDNMDRIYRITIRYLLNTLIKKYQAGS
ncbi:cytoglobin-1-like [Babylonia areolata]|uniref:cytoglobin-1-like n=1 Tax=Babylonia areolata TaxID=304850 RepID=UPI003FD3F5C3